MLTQQSMIHGKYHGKPVTYLVTFTWGLGKMWECADNADSRVSVDHVMGKSHKMIAQINRTNESHKMITQDKMTSHPRMEMTNDAFGCSRATQVCMEDLRLVNLTEFHPKYAYE